MNLQAESVAHPVPAVKATAPGWLWPSVVALAPAAFFSESFLSHLLCHSQWFSSHGSIPRAGPCCWLDFQSLQLEGGRTQAMCEGRTRLCRADVSAPADNFLGIGDGCPQGLLLPPPKQGWLQAVPKHTWFSACSFCPSLVLPSCCAGEVKGSFSQMHQQMPHRGPKDRDGWAGSCNICRSLLRIITSCTSRNSRS